MLFFLFNNTVTGLTFWENEEHWCNLTHTWIIIHILLKMHRCTNIFFAYIKWKHRIIKCLTFFLILPSYIDGTRKYRMLVNYLKGHLTAKRLPNWQLLTTEPMLKMTIQYFPTHEIIVTLANMLSCHLLLHAVMVLIYEKNVC